jgi:predicted ATPase
VFGRADAGQRRNNTYDCGGNAAEAAEREFHCALNLARYQDALSWELRAATSLARLKIASVRSAGVREVLAQTVGRFSEGFSTRDYKEARELLEYLA